MPKERNFNPVQAQRKADKAKAVKKGKAEVQERRNEKLARKNPERIQKQIDDLKAITSNGATLSRHEEQVLNGLEKELKAVTRARTALGERAPTFSSGGRRDESRSGVLGKRRRDSRDASSSSEEDVPQDVRSIPMPRDTPPPIAREVLDQWYARRRARRNMNRNGTETRQEARMDAGTDTAIKGPTVSTGASEAKTVYEAKPVIRDLQKEAVSALVPASVQAKMMRGRGQGGLIEPEEADQLEKEGYLQATRKTEEHEGWRQKANEDRQPPRRQAAVEDAAEEEE
ncbi:hypothetical protein CDD81_7413 [Ophiocordyceps australis]|uniref:Wbp11/ELF5/Saf1 N-terminal domain-containing protein n=1 Tax=Ophiocordyceps australis TaxID=1399860 RepID=A0A2C5XLE3_9HYPO|nr:hypothetical protein CDD81_7413 [Ophiocordyceps australis]